MIFKKEKTDFIRYKIRDKLCSGVYLPMIREDIYNVVGKIEGDPVRQIFTAPLDWGHKVHLRLCLHTIVEISDRSEDAADQLELAIIKSRI